LFGFVLLAHRGRILSEPFLQKPPKKKYPDYYVIIQQPIALDDIKKRLETNQYPSLEAVKQDFELLFNNAKQYNLPESQIFLDAKDLLVCLNNDECCFIIIFVSLS